VTSPRNEETATSDVRAETSGRGALDALLDVSVPVVIEFGRTSMMLQDVLELQPGSVIQLDRTVGEPVDIFVSDRKLAAGEVVVVDDHFGIQITDILADRNGGAKE
jgi:flagellar motor switch protein FliN/FliY